MIYININIKCFNNLLVVLIVDVKTLLSSGGKLSLWVANSKCIVGVVVCPKHAPKLP